MVAILAIEQLTGATKASQPTLNPKAEAVNLPSTQAGAGGTATDEASDKTAGAKKADDAASADLKKKKKAETAAVDDANANPDDAAKQDSADKAKAALEVAKSKKTATTTALKEAQQSKPENDKPAATDAPSDRAAIATAVQGIVDQTLGLAFSRELCVTVLSEYPKETLNQNQDNTVGRCIAYLSKTVDLAEAENAAFRANTKLVEACAESIQKSKDGEAPCMSVAAASKPGPPSIRMFTDVQSVDPKRFMYIQKTLKDRPPFDPRDPQPSPAPPTPRP
jgi:hypothetical protein